MKKDYSFSYLLLPLAFLLVLAGGLLVQRAGIQYDTAEKPGDIKLLPQANVNVADFFPNKPVEALVLFDPQELNAKDELNENIKATLDGMRVKYDRFDISSGQIPAFTNYQTVIVATPDLARLESQLGGLIDWVGAGGRVLFATRPIPSVAFSDIAEAVGIMSGQESLVQASGIEFITDLMVGGKGLSLETPVLNHLGFSVQLSEDTIVHLVSADESKLPVLWQHNYGKGRFVFINTGTFGGKEGRGITSAAYSLLQDVFVYPVINSSVFFLDDFPSPVPAGSNDLITKQYGMDIDHFYTNVWWPDLQALAKKYNYKYSGVIIETYDDKLVPPFKKQMDTDRHQYFAKSLLADGGEVGLHGYNHISLCLAETGVNQLLGYSDGWPTTEAMQLSVYELFGFAGEILPGNKFETFVPASNVLCSGARIWLPAVLPNLKVIASVYINNPEKTAYEQEFTESSDGIIELPRIVAGYAPNNFDKWAVINELTFHYVNSHFAHPDDVLSEDRGSKRTWDSLRNQFEDYVKWLYSSAPGLRSMTAKQGAVAVQRYVRLAVDARMVNGAYEINLGNFYDEASLMLRSPRKPASIEGGTISSVSSDMYLIRASKAKIVVKFEGETP